MEESGEVPNGATGVAPVQPTEAAASGIPIERVAEVIEQDPTPLFEKPKIPPHLIPYKRKNRLENSPFFDEVKHRFQSGTSTNLISRYLDEVKAFPGLSYHGIRSMVDRALMRAKLMRPTASLGPKFGRSSHLPRAPYTSTHGEKMLLTRQLAKRYKVSDTAVRSWVKRGVLNLKEVGATQQGTKGHWYFPLDGIERWERKTETFQQISAVRIFTTRQNVAQGGTENYLSIDQIGARYGLTGSGVQNWIKRGLFPVSEILANGGFTGDGRALFVPESYILRWEKTPRAQELNSVRNYHSDMARQSTHAGFRETVLNLVDLGKRYGVTSSAIGIWVKNGAAFKGVQKFFDVGSRSWRIPLSFIEEWESSPDARRASLNLRSLRRFLSKKRTGTTPVPARGIARPGVWPDRGASKEVDVAAIARQTGLAAQDIRKVLEKAGLHPTALKLPQTSISEIEAILTAGGVAKVTKGSGREFIVERTS